MKRGVVDRYFVIIIVTLVSLVILSMIILKGQPYFKAGLENLFNFG